MFEVTLNLNIPLKILNVDAGNSFEAVENCRDLISATLPLLISNNIDQIRNEMTFILGDVHQVNE